MVEAVLMALRERLSQASEARFAEGQRRFFQHQVDTWGVRGPQVQAVARDLYRDVKTWPVRRRDALCTELLKSRKLEEGALVCHVYRRFARECGEREFRMFERWVDRYVDNWATCDGIASWLLAACVANEPGLIAELPEWTQSANPWKRRASAVALLQEGKAGRNTGAILDIARRLIPDTDDTVQKGVGWLLKETYPKSPREVVAFLRRQAGASRLVLRYAAEKMTPTDRAAVLAKARARVASGPA
jgi:3-methyladenine DNA glycosylase AlkD